jgi:hypothetical protein
MVGPWCLRSSVESDDTGFTISVPPECNVTVLHQSPSYDNRRKAMILSAGNHGKIERSPKVRTSENFATLLWQRPLGGHGGQHSLYLKDKGGATENGQGGRKGNSVKDPTGVPRRGRGEPMGLRAAGKDECEGTGLGESARLSLALMENCR